MTLIVLAGNTSPRIHGGADALGVPRYDFSTNSNACGPCPQVVQALQACDASYYPDPSYTALREQLAAFHGVSPSRVLLAGSASEFIFRMTAWTAQQGGLQVGVPAHGYADYAHAAQAWGLEVVCRTAASDQGLQPPLAWYCDPSSPLGQPDVLATQGVAVLDRAYEPLRLHGTPGWSNAQLNKVWQLWTPNKALGLTGVRAAYAIAPLDDAKTVAALERLSPSWPVGAHGVALLQAWTESDVQAWLADSLVTLRGWKSRQMRLLEALGWVCEPSLANFFCARPARHAESDLKALLVNLREQGVKLRDTTSFGLAGSVRVSVQAPDAQDALAAALKSVAREQFSETT